MRLWWLNATTSHTQTVGGQAKKSSMDKQTFIVKGDNFLYLESFYDENDRVLIKDFDWQTGHKTHVMTCSDNGKNWY